MASQLVLQKYDSSFEEKWDKFVTCSSNGTFLQTRNFLNYHPMGRFSDSSILVMKGNEIVACLPANTVEMQDGTKSFFSHQGSTFGGLILQENAIRINTLEEIFNLLEDFFMENRYTSVSIKQPGRIFCKQNMDLLEYFFFNKGYQTVYEVGYYIDSNCYNKDITSNLTSSRRRDYKYSLKNDFVFQEVYTKIDVGHFYDVLLDNYTKFNTTPVHTLDELIEFHEKRLPENTRFFGVYYNQVMIAGAMVFCFEKRVFHTQYLAVLNDYSHYFANEFLYVSLITQALEDGFRYISFGSTVLDGGYTLNYNLARFKEGFGTSQYNNKTFVKRFQKS